MNRRFEQKMNIHLIQQLNIYIILLKDQQKNEKLRIAKILKKDLKYSISISSIDLNTFSVHNVQKRIKKKNKKTFNIN